MPLIAARPLVKRLGCDYLATGDYLIRSVLVPRAGCRRCGPPCGDRIGIGRCKLQLPARLALLALVFVQTFAPVVVKWPTRLPFATVIGGFTPGATGGKRWRIIVDNPIGARCLLTE